MHVPVINARSVAEEAGPCGGVVRASHLEQLGEGTGGKLRLTERHREKDRGIETVTTHRRRGLGGG